MRILLLTAAILASATARPELYKESEDFQYSRSSSDEGSKAGYYGAQRGNMGGNYEKAHNMDTLAQHQMSGIVRQVKGELGDGANTNTGDVFASANSRGIYGSGKYDLSNLQGRNFGEGLHYADNSHSSHSSHSSGYNAHSSSHSSGYSSNNNLQSSRYQGLSHSGSALHNDNLQVLDNTQSTQGGYGASRQTGYSVLHSDNLQALDNSQSTQGGYGASRQTGYSALHSDNLQALDNSQSAHGGYGASRQTGYSALHSDNLQALDNSQSAHGGYGASRQTGYSSGQYLQSEYQGHTAHDTSNANQYVSSGYHSYPQNRLVYTVPVRIVGRPGSRVAVPVGVQTYDATHSATAVDQNAINSEAEVLSNSDHNINYKPSSNAKHYESSYKYHKQWEKHDTKPEVVVLAVTTENPFPKNSELYDDSAVSSNNYHAARSNAQSDHSSSAYNRYNTKSLTSQSGFNSHYGGASTTSNSEAYTNAAHNSGSLVNAANLVGDVNSRPKSYQSSYSYHKAWERQGDPYVIEPVGAATAGQASQRLTATSNNQGYTSHQYGTKQHQSHQSISAIDCDCDENGHIRVARSVEQEPQTQTGWENLNDLGQSSQNLEQWNQGFDNLKDLGQQSQDLGQQAQSNWDQNLEKLQDLGQQTQDLGQQSQTGWGQGFEKLEDLGQQSQDLEQQAQTGWGQGFEKLEDLGQQSQDLGQQAQTGWNQGYGRLENFSQQSQNSYNELTQTQRTEDFGQQTQTGFDHVVTEEWNKPQQFTNPKLSQQMGPGFVSPWKDGAGTTGQEFNSWNFQDQQHEFQSNYGMFLTPPQTVNAVDNVYTSPGTTWSQEQTNTQHTNTYYIQQTHNLNWNVNNHHYQESNANQNSFNSKQDVNILWNKLDQFEQGSALDFSSSTNSFSQNSTHSQNSDQNIWEHSVYNSSDANTMQNWYGQQEQHGQHTFSNNNWSPVTTGSEHISSTTFKPFTTTTFKATPKVKSATTTTTTKSKLEDSVENVRPLDVGRGDIGAEEDLQSDSVVPEVLPVFTLKPYKSPEEIEALSLRREINSMANSDRTQHKIEETEKNKTDQTQSFDDSLNVLSLDQQNLVNNQKHKTIVPSTVNVISTTYEQIPRNQENAHEIGYLDTSMQNTTAWDQNFKQFGQEQNGNFGQESQSAWDQSKDSLGQEQNEDLAQQSQTRWGGNFEYESQGTWGQSSDYFEHQQNENLGQQSQTTWGQNSEYLVHNQSEQNLNLNHTLWKEGPDYLINNQSKNLDQKGQSTWALGSENYGQQQNENLDQQIQTSWETTSDKLDHQGENSVSQSQYNPDDLNQQVQRAWKPDNLELATEYMSRSNPGLYNKENKMLMQKLEEVHSPPEISKKFDNVETVEIPPQVQTTTTEKPGFWKSVGNKFANAKDKVSSWFKRS